MIGDCTGAGFLTYPAHQFDAGHTPEIQIGNDEGRRREVRHFKSLVRIIRRADTVLEALEDHGHDNEALGVVVHNEHKTAAT